MSAKGGVRVRSSSLGMPAAAERKRRVEGAARRGLAGVHRRGVEDSPIRRKSSQRRHTTAACIYTIAPKRQLFGLETRLLLRLLPLLLCS